MFFDWFFHFPLLNSSVSISLFLFLLRRKFVSFIFWYLMTNHVLNVNDYVIDNYSIDIILHIYCSIENCSVDNLGLAWDILRVSFQEGESFSCSLFLLNEEHEKVLRWIWSPLVRHIYQVFSCGLHISSLDRNWWPFSKWYISFEKSCDKFWKGKFLSEILRIVVMGPD